MLLPIYMQLHIHHRLVSKSLLFIGQTLHLAGLSWFQTALPLTMAYLLIVDLVVKTLTLTVLHALIGRLMIQIVLLVYNLLYVA